MRQTDFHLRRFATDDRSAITRDSTPLKVYIVTILDCENEAHAHKLAEFLRASFPHGAEQTTDTPPINLTIIVKAESLEFDTRNYFACA